VNPILLAGLILLNVHSEKTARKIIWGLTGSGTLVAFWGIIQKFGFGYLLPHQSLDPSFRSYLITGRSFGPFESPNYLGMYLAPISLLLFFYWLKTKLTFFQKTLSQKKQVGTQAAFFEWQIKDFLVLFCFLVMLLALFFTQSLGAWLGFGIAMLLGIFLYFRPLLYYLNPKSKFIFDIAYLICTLLLILGSFVLIKKMGCRVENSFAARQEVWQVAWYLARKHPLTGIGLGLFPLFYHQTVAHLHFPPLNWFQLHPHNLFFAFWLNLGLLGLLAFLWLLLVAFRQIIKNQQLFLLTPLLAIVIHGLVDTTYWKNDLSVIFWIFLALTFLFWQDAKEDSA
jgi:O-antigen ligase